MSEESNQQHRPVATTRLMWWQATTPVHAGTGQDSAGSIDLPAAREGGTGFPLLPASGIKGSLREGGEDDVSRRRFGHADPDNGDGSHAAELNFTDARLICLPVPSYAGTYALVTCPLVLHRLKRDLGLFGIADVDHALQVPAGPAREAGDRFAAFVTTDLLQVKQSTVILNDLDFQATVKPFTLPGLARLDPHIEKRLMLVHDDVFAYLCETALDVSTHVALDSESKTVLPGQLWYEECLPAESILASFVTSGNLQTASTDLTWLGARRLWRIGGKSTVGRGLLRTSLAAA